MLSRGGEKQKQHEDRDDQPESLNLVEEEYVCSFLMLYSALLLEIKIDHQRNQGGDGMGESGNPIVTKWVCMNRFSFHGG